MLYHARFDGMTKQFNRYSIMAYGYLITINYDQHEKAVYEEPGIVKWDFKENSQACEYVTPNLAPTDLSAPIKNKLKYIQTAASNSKIAIWQLT